MITLTQPVRRTTARKPAVKTVRRAAVGAVPSSRKALLVARNAAGLVALLALLGATLKAALGFAAALGLIVFVLPVPAAICAGVWVFTATAEQGRTMVVDLFALALAATAAVVVPLAAASGAVFGFAGVLGATTVAAAGFALVSVLAVDVASHRVAAFA